MYVFGSATLVSFLIQVVTGIALATGYVSSAGAHQLLKWISDAGFHGQSSARHALLRCIRHGAAPWPPHDHAPHILTGSYKFPRETELDRGGALFCSGLDAADGVHRAVAALGSERGVVHNCLRLNRRAGFRSIGLGLAGPFD